jgi:hypothetical protein
MTLTVRDLVTKFNDFADDAIVKMKQSRYDGEIEVGVIIRNIVDIKKDGDGNVFLILEFPLNNTVTLTVRDLVTNLINLPKDAKVTVKRFLGTEGTYSISKIVDIKRDGHDNAVLLTKFVLIKNDAYEESEKEKSEDQDFDFEKE